MSDVRHPIREIDHAWKIAATSWKHDGSISAYALFNRSVIDALCCASLPVGTVLVLSKFIFPAVTHWPSYFMRGIFWKYFIVRDQPCTMAILWRLPFKINPISLGFACIQNTRFTVEIVDKDLTTFTLSSRKILIPLGRFTVFRTKIDFLELGV